MFGLMKAKSRVSRWLVAAAIGSSVLFPPAAQAQVVAVVYGEPITARDIDHRMRLEQLSGGKVAGRKDVLDLLINDKLKIREAKRFTITITDREVDDAFANMAGRMRLKPDQLTEQMARAGTSATTIKNRLRADMAWARLVRGRYSSTLTVSEQDILSALGAQSTGDALSYEYTLRPILFVVPDGSPDSAFASRKREAETLRGRFRDCDSGLRTARAMRDVAVRGKIVRTSADLPEGLRKVLGGLDVGQLTTPEVTKHGVEMFALCDKVQTRADTPQKREAREKLAAERYEEKAKDYLADIRRSALIEYK